HAEDVLGRRQRQTRFGEHDVGAGQRFLTRPAFWRLPLAKFWGDVHSLLLRQHETGMRPRPQRDRTSWCQVGLAVEQACEAHLPAAYLSLHRDAREYREDQASLEHIDPRTGISGCGH